MVLDAFLHGAQSAAEGFLSKYEMASIEEVVSLVVFRDAAKRVEHDEPSAGDLRGEAQLCRARA
jgi:hypothetical protein